MTKEEILNIKIGDRLSWTPDLESPDLQGFKNSNQYYIFEEKGVTSLEIQVVENRHGFKNSLSFEMYAKKSDGSYLSEWEFGYNEEQRKDFAENPQEGDEAYINDLKNRPWVETDEDTRWLGYLLSKGEKYFDLI